MKKRPMLEIQAHLNEQKSAAEVAFGFARFLVFCFAAAGIITIVSGVTGWRQ